MRAIGDVIFRAEGPCDCGDVVRHNDGGNYHPVVLVVEGRSGYVVILTDTRFRRAFGDEPEFVDGVRIYPDERIIRVDDEATALEVARALAEKWGLNEYPVP